MTQVPSGWYPDPAAPQDGFGQRYWDGRQWTDHVQPGGSPGFHGGSASGRPLVATTPDGEVLAGWWHRVGAYLIDGLVLTVVSIVAGLPLLVPMVRDYVALMSTAQPGSVPAAGAYARLADQTAGPAALFGLVALVLGFVYNVGFLKWKQATPGKLLVGLKVRRREVAGPLPWATVLTRWVTQNWFSLLFLVPVLGALVRLYLLLDDLWPLWDGKRQALHDKAAGTNVVRR